MRKAIRKFSLLFFCAATTWAQGWVVSPARQELTVRPGETRTFSIRVEREAAAGANDQVRFTASPGDWDLTRSGEVILGRAQTMSESASGWMTFTPAGFTLNPGGIANIRVSIAVPKETQSGLYRAGLFFEEHSVIPPQAENTRRMVLRYRLSTLVYVRVPPLSKRIEVKDVQVAADAAGHLVVSAVLDNMGTAHLRPQHWIEVRDHAGQLLLQTGPKPTTALLPGHQLEVKLASDRALPPLAQYQVRYVVDAGHEVALQVTTVKLMGELHGAGIPKQ